MKEMEKRIEIDVVSSLEKQLKEGLPSLKIDRATALKNEKFHFQIAVSALAEAESLSLKAYGANGALAFYDVEYILGGPAWVKFQDDYYLAKDKREYPDLLKLHTQPFSLPKGERKYIYVCVDCERLGVGVNEFRFECDGEFATFTLEILPVELVEHDLILTNWMHYDCICSQHNVEPFTDEFYKVFAEYLRLYVEMENNMLFTPLFTPPIDTAVGGERMTVQLVDVEQKDGEYRFDFSKLKKFMQFCSDQGVKYFEFSQLFTQWGAKSCPKVMVKGEDGEIFNRFGWKVDSTDGEYLRFLSKVLQELCENIKAWGFAERVFFHVSDEAQEEDFERVEKLFKFVKENIGAYKIIDTTSNFRLVEKGYLDVPVISTRCAEAIEQGKNKSMTYYCSVEHDDYRSNRFFCMPLQRTRVLGYQLYANEMWGFLHWGFNFYNSYLSQRKVDPYVETDALGYYPSGDSYVVYPTEQGATPSIRYMTLIEAFQDYRALKTLEKQKGKAFVLKLLQEEGVSGISNYPRNNEWHLAFRERINEMLYQNSKNLKEKGE